jgi:hypothetical protein
MKRLIQHYSETPAYTDPVNPSSDEIALRKDKLYKLTMLLCTILKKVEPANTCQVTPSMSTLKQPPTYFIAELRKKSLQHKTRQDWIQTLKNLYRKITDPTMNKNTNKNKNKNTNKNKKTKRWFF